MGCFAGISFRDSFPYIPERVYRGFSVGVSAGFTGTPVSGSVYFGYSDFVFRTDKFNK